MQLQFGYYLGALIGLEGAEQNLSSGTRVKGLKVANARRVPNCLLSLDYCQVDNAVTLARGQDNGFSRTIPQVYKRRFKSRQPRLAPFDGLRDIEQLPCWINLTAGI
jgi:hypothetical protein